MVSIRCEHVDNREIVILIVELIILSRVCIIKEIMNKKVTLKDITMMQSGIYMKTDSQGEVRYVQVKDVDPESRLDYTQVATVINTGINDKHWLKKGDLLFDYDNIVHLIVSKKFENLQDAQGYAWSNYDMNFNDSLKQLQNKIKREYQDIMDKLEKTNAREILKHIKQIYSLKMVRDVFDNEVGIFMPKATVDYLLKEDVNATDELADRVSEYDRADFHNENVQTAVEDIQIEQEKEFESINTYEPELEL